jgi:hypothetical protein
MKLTERTAAALTLPPGKTDSIFFDDMLQGFGLRLREGGSRSWVYQYRVGPRQHRVNLGNASAIPLSLARENAARLAAKVTLGENPMAQREIARQEAAHTVGILVDQYLEARASSWRPKDSFRECLLSKDSSEGAAPPARRRRDPTQHRESAQ